MGLKLRIGTKGAREPYGERLGTDEVLKHLDNRYGILGDFVERHTDDILEAATLGMQQVIEARMRGDRGHRYAAILDAGTKVARMLSDDILHKRFDHLPGVPTAAAIRGDVAYGRTIRGPRGGASKPLQPNRPSFIFSTTLMGDVAAAFVDDTGEFAPKEG